jgi:transposase
MLTDTELAEKFAIILSLLDERQRRLVLAAEARSLGYGGITRVARASGMSRFTIQKGMAELEEPGIPRDRIRRAGGGRKGTRRQDETLWADLEALIEPDSRGDPMSPLRWTCKSTRQLAEALNQQGHQVSRNIVAALLHDADYSLQANRKTLEGSHQPDRDAQFRYINDQTKTFLAHGWPVVSVDAKKKELGGLLRMAVRPGVRKASRNGSMSTIFRIRSTGRRSRMACMLSDGIKGG